MTEKIVVLDMMAEARAAQMRPHLPPGMSLSYGTAPGDEAMKAFEEVKPAVVLLDVMMPGRDGWQVCREMKQHPTLGKTVRVVMVTALDDWVNKRQALQTGADDYVEKPFELSKLATTLERNVKLVAPNTGGAQATATRSR